MRNIIISFALLLMFSLTVKAEVEGNPDRFPSIGLNIGNTSIDGKATLNPTDNRLSENTYLSNVGLDLRIPANRSITFGVYYNRIDGSQDSKVKSAFGTDVSNYNESLSGYNYGVNIRLYLNH